MRKRRNSDVIQGPHGFTFKYSIPSEDPDQATEPCVLAKHPEFIAQLHEERRLWLEMEQARLADPMPDPAELAVSQLIDFLVFVERAFPILSTSPIVRDQYVRRENTLSNSQGFKDFTEWRKVAPLHRMSPTEAAKELLARLVDIGVPMSEANATRVADAIVRVGQPNLPPKRESKWNDAVSCTATALWRSFGGKGPAGIRKLKQLKTNKDIIDYKKAGSKYLVLMPSETAKTELLKRLVDDKTKDNRGGSRQNVAKHGKTMSK